MGQLKRYFLAANNERGCVSGLFDEAQDADLAALGFVRSEGELKAVVDPPKIGGDLLAKAKALKIKGAHLMSPDTLKAKIAEVEG